MDWIRLMMWLARELGGCSLCHSPTEHSECLERTSSTCEELVFARQE